MVVEAWADLATGAALTLAGAWTLRTRVGDVVGWLLCAAAATWFLGSLLPAGVPVLPGLAAAASALLFVHRALLGHALLLTASGPGPAAHDRAWVWSTAAVVVGYPAAVLPWATTAAVVIVVGLTQAGTAVVLARRRGRRTSGTWLLALSGTVAWVLAAGALDLVPGLPATGRLALYELGIVAAAAGTALCRERTHRVVDRAMRAVEAGGSTSLVSALRTALQDDSLRIHLDGGPEHQGTGATRLELGGRGSVVVEHRPGLLDDRRLRRDLTAVVAAVVEERELSARISAAARDAETSHGRALEAERTAAAELAEAVELRVQPLLRSVVAVLASVPAPPAQACRLLADLERELADVAARTGEAEVDLADALAVVVRDSAVPARLVAARCTVGAAQARALGFTVREALANAAKHAGATHVVVRLTGTSRTLTVSVEDDGQGGAVVTPGGGLAGLQTRLAAAGGRLDVRSDEAGTLVAGQVPR